jgi:hypothetical protein
LAPEGFDKYFFAHKKLQAVTGLYPGADGRSAPWRRALEVQIIAGTASLSFARFSIKHGVMALHHGSVKGP